MVTLILVSHSAALAQAVRELALQMAPDCPIHLAAGLDDADNPIGTDAVAIMQATEQADNDSGIVILVDLGSAILSAQTALELVAPTLAEKVRLAPAPFVEGAIAAAVSAAGGADADGVVRDACAALIPKQQALGEIAAPAPAENAPPAQEAARITVTVANAHGLHARPAAKIVALFKKYRAEVWLECGGRRANARKINDIAALAARSGDRVTLSATGEDAAQALQAFAELADSRFGEG